MSDRELIEAALQVLASHQALPASLLGDELRRRWPELWAWKRRERRHFLAILAKEPGLMVEFTNKEKRPTSGPSWHERL